MVERSDGQASYWPVLFFGCLILIISMGARSAFGLFLPDMTAAHGWSRELFSFAIAMQNLVWGVAGFFLGAIADKYGSMRVIMIGGLLYALGVLGMAHAESGLMLTLACGLLIGVGIGGTAFGIVFSTLGKIVPEEKRPLAFGLGVASGSFGQFLFLPLNGHLLQSVGWHNALLTMAAFASLMILLGLGIRGDTPDPDKTIEFNFKEALSTALRDRSFHLLFWGYFVCGLQVVFIALHLPAYLIDQGVSANVGATAVALIGLFNIAGSIIAGLLGQRLSRKWLLAGIYVARSVVMVAFLAAPISQLSIYLFAAGIGMLWLSTVPLTTALVGQRWGVRYLGMLGGIIFLGHQIGSFTGAWLGGRIFDTTGSYDLAWMMMIGFGVFAAVMHAPIDQRPLASRALLAPT